MQHFLKRVLEKIDKLEIDKVRDLCYELLNEQERLSAVIESLPEGILIGDEHHRILHINRAFHLLVPVGDAPLAHEPLWKSIEDEDIAEFCHTHLTTSAGKNEEIFTLSTSRGLRTLKCVILPLVSQNKIVGNIVRIEDISEEQLNAARLYRAEQLASLTNLTANVAHEIKNPLASIGIYIQLMRRAMDKKHIDRQLISDNLVIIKEEIDRLNDIVVDFLFSVRPIDLRMQEVSLHNIIKECIDLLRPEMEAGSIETTQSINRDIPTIDGDRKYLKQAFINVMKNAIEAMPHGGALRIQARATSSDVEITIADNGIGIDPALSNKIFEPYFTTKDTGSGIGLTEVYKIIHEHLGEITLRPASRAGTECVITLPVSRSSRRLLTSREERQA